MIFPEGLKTTKEKCVVAREASRSMIFRTLSKIGPRRSGKHNVVAVLLPHSPKSKHVQSETPGDKAVKKGGPEKGGRFRPGKGEP